MSLPQLTFRQSLTYAAHLFKAVTKQHHREMRSLFARYLPPDAVVFDVGAHAGQFAKLFAGLVPRGQVYAFEPGSYARAILERMVTLRRLANVEVVPFGLSNAPGESVLSVPLKRSGSFGFGLSHFGTAQDDGRARWRETVALTTLDRFVAERGVARLDFIKADVEGWEIAMLQGAAQSLARFRPAMLLELVEAHLARAGTRPDQAWDMLLPLGYQAWRVLGADELEPAPRFLGPADYLFDTAVR